MGARWRYPMALAGGGLGIALISSGTVYALVARPAPAQEPVYPAPSWTLPSRVDAEVLAPPSPTATVPIPNTKITIFEHASDPVWLTAYRLGQDSYVRTGDAFTRLSPPGVEAVPSPGGAWLALLSGTSLRLVDQRTKQEMPITLPAAGQRPVWSRDGEHLLLTAANGFLHVDLATREPELVETEGDRGPYAWLPDGSGVLVGAERGLRFRDLHGAQIRSMPSAGRVFPGDPFSPDGRRLLTYCQSIDDYCVWDVGRGALLASLDWGEDAGTLLAWYDDDHFVTARRVVVGEATVATMDLRGRERRTLATLKSDDPETKDEIPALVYSRRR